MRSTAEHLEGNLVRLSVEMDEAEVEGIITESYRTLSRQARVPGFRPGKVPRQVLEARLGGAVALRAEALRDALPDLYGKAVVEANLDPIAPPEIDITAGTESGPLTFDAVVQVRPLVGIPGYAGLRVEVPEFEATDDDVDGQIDRMRDTEAELVEVGRPAIDGDHVTVDVKGTGSGGEEAVAADDYLYEVGTAALGPEVDAVLRGAKPGNVLTAEAVVPGPGDGDGVPISFRLLVKEVKEKRLPDLNDAWAAESSDFDTVEALRADVRLRVDSVKKLQARMAMNEGAMRALAELVDEAQVPAVLVNEEVQARLHRFEHRLAEGKIGIEEFFASTGRSPDEFLAEMRAGALSEVKGDLALLALAEAEEIEATDDEVDEEIAAMAQRLDVQAGTLRSRLEQEDRIPAVRSERRKRKAYDWLVEHVELVDSSGIEVPRKALEIVMDTDGEPTQEADEA